MTIRNRITELRHVRAGDLKANPKNWRKHPKAQRQALQAILDDVGYADALIARDTPDGLMLLDGHLRADLTPDATVPVLVTDLDDAEADTVLATLDPLAAMAEPDTEKLRSLVDGLAAKADEAMADLLDRMHGLSKPDLPDEEPLTEEPEPRAKRGEVWQLGRHRLMCGDSSNDGDVVKLLDGVNCDLVLTDPPYLLTGLGGGGIAGTAHMYQSGILDPMMAFDFDAHKSVLTDHAPMLIAFHSRDQIPQYAALASATKRTYDLHVWHKTNSPPFTHHTWKSDLEYIALLWEKKPGWKQVDQSRCSKLYQSATISDDAHPTVKPVELLEKYIEILAAQRIFDPFVGSGTTIIAAERQGRACYAMEVEPRYADMAIARWVQYTGGKAEVL